MSKFAGTLAWIFLALNSQADAADLLVTGSRLTSQRFEIMAQHPDFGTYYVAQARAPFIYVPVGTDIPELPKYGSANVELSKTATPTLRRGETSGNNTNTIVVFRVEVSYRDASGVIKKLVSGNYCIGRTNGSKAYACESTGTEPPGPDEDPQAPAAPTGLLLSLSSEKVQLSWSTSSESGVSYQVERSDAFTGVFGVIGQAPSASYSDANVAAGNSYSYRVRAKVGDLMSEPSSAMTISIPALPPPPAGEAINVLSYGANPSSAGDDTAPIRAAFLAAKAQNKDVYFPEGHYWTTGELIFNVTGKSVYGSENGRSVIAGNTSHHDLIVVTASNVTIRDLRFEGSHCNSDHFCNTGAAVEPRGSTQGTIIKRVYAYGTGYIVFDNGATNTVLEDSVLEDYGRIGYLANTGAIIRRNRFFNREGWRMTSEMHGIYVSAGKKNITIEDNEFTNVGYYSIQLWGSQVGVATENILIQRNLFVRSPSVMVVAAGANGPIYRNVRFINNVAKQTQNKVFHIGKFTGKTSDYSQLLIEGNTFEDPGAGYFMHIAPWAGSAPISGIRVKNNRIFSNAERFPYRGFSLESGVSDVIIEGNEVFGIGHNTGNTEGGLTGIHLYSGIKNVTIAANKFRHFMALHQNEGHERSR